MDLHLDGTHAVGLDLLVNNAGGIPRGGDDPGHLGGFTAIDDEAWLRTVELNLFSAVRVTRALIDALLRRGGVIVNVSSIGARVAGPPIDYGVAKAGLTNLTVALSEEYAPRGVRAVTVSPGPTRTALWTAADSPAADMARALGIGQDDLLAASPGRWASARGASRSPRRPRRRSRSSPRPSPARSPGSTSSSTAAR
jgi:putative oxidoreductase